MRYVYPDSPALKAGIEPGDRIVSIAGEPVTSPQTLQDQIAAHEPLDTVKVELDARRKIENGGGETRNAAGSRARRVAARS